METRNTFVVCALTLAALSCSDAVPPPASMGMTLNLYGVTSVRETIPQDPEVTKLNTSTSPMVLESLMLLQDGDEDASVRCKVKEVAAGTAYEISGSYKDARQLTQYSVAATTMGGTSAAGFVSVKTPLTGGETYQGRACTVQTSNAQEGGGAIVVHFTCDANGSLNNLTNCSDTATDCDKTLDGDVIMYIKNCSKS